MRVILERMLQMIEHRVKMKRGDAMKSTDITYTLSNRFSPAYTSRVQELRAAFFRGELADPTACSEIEPYIARSWLRCKEIGVDPQTTLKMVVQKHGHCFGGPKTDMDFELIRLAAPLIEAFDYWTPVQHFFVSLDSAVTYSRLLSNGSITEDMDWNIAGKLTEEKYAGNNAIALARIEGHPVCIQGGEFYCHNMDDCFLASAPIFDSTGNMVAILNMGTLGSVWSGTTEDRQPQLVYSLIMSVISSLAASLESKLQLSQAEEHLKHANVKLETTLSLIDHGVIVLDGQGQIQAMNTKAIQYLRIPAGKVDCHIAQFLPPGSTLMRRIIHAENSDFEEKLIVDGRGKGFQIQLRPLPGDNGAVLILQKTTELNRLAATRAGLQAKFHFEDLIGNSIFFRSVVDRCRHWSHSFENVLLMGESGTGKELFAQSIHNESAPSGPFVAVNCAAIPRELIESELFGYEQGSFTGADRNGRPGKIELAHHGTLFLDEIGDMPMELQAVLLRVLESKQVSRIGGVSPRKIDFRLIAATNQDLRKRVSENRFRQDLFYRLSVLQVTIPPLRNRKGDALILAQYFLQKYCAKLMRPVPSISPEAEKLLVTSSWPGNVRQLENAIIYALHTMEGETLLPEHLQVDQGATGHQNELTIEPVTIADAEKAAIERAIICSEGNMTRAASILGIGKTTLYRKIKEYDLEK